MRKRNILLVLVVLLSGISVNARQLDSSSSVIDITKFGGDPDTRVDVSVAVRRALDYCKGRPGTTLRFPKGRYDFWPTYAHGEKWGVGFDLYRQHQLTIDGGGSEFIFHGLMSVVRMDSCSEIKICNFSVDWERPFISQAEIVGATDSCLDVKIDREKYPYIVENDTLQFIGEGWKLPAMDNYGTLYDKEKKEVVYNTWDMSLGEIFQKPAEVLPDGTVRFHAAPKIRPVSGTYVSLFHLKYSAPGFSILNSRNVLMKDIILFHALGHGVYGVRTENITMERMNMTVNDAKGRVFSVVADASHFVNCKGKIKVEHCTHTGQGDDFINVHGRYIRVDRVIDTKTIEVDKEGYYINCGDSLWFIFPDMPQRKIVRKVKDISPSAIDKPIPGYVVSFTQDLPVSIVAGYYLENRTWTAGLELRGCKILKRNRARGVLVTTPQEVIIENNYFHTAGTAILVEGDMDYWYESGAIEKMNICNNVFDDCLTSGNKRGDRWQWGEAIITVTPSHQPQTVFDLPYHRNIRISDNVFKVFDTPLLRARSVEGLYFGNNNIIRTRTYQPYTWQKNSFLLDGCRNVRIENNKLDSAYTIRTIEMQHMRDVDVKIENNNFQLIRPYEHFTPEKLWLDSSNVPINAHGGGILYDNQRYYWFGEHKTEGESGNFANVGVHCYSSEDLYNWKDEGVVLKVDPEGSGSDIEKGCILERPKVIYNAKTDEYVMWFHLESKGNGYAGARSGVAISNCVTGPYVFIKSVRPNAGYWPINKLLVHKLGSMSNGESYMGGDLPAHPDSLNLIGRDWEGGQMARDMNLFVDDDGKAYHIYSSEENSTLHIALLNDEYTGYSGIYKRLFVGRFMEAPAMFKRKRKYYLMMSGCTGWLPNAARSAVADSIFGEWKELGNPCVGKNAEKTFNSQSTCILKIEGEAEHFIYMGDRWNPKNAINGRYIWLPLSFDSDRFFIKWKNQWRLEL